MTESIYILLGSNKGDRLSNLERAIQQISLHVGIINQKSSIYETAAWGKTDQSAFLNSVIRIKSKLLPEALLDKLLEIERSIGRLRTERWGPREIDLDILFFGDLVIKSEHLQVPHPAIQNRRFTLIPLAEIAPNFVHPMLQKNCLQLLNECTDTLEVTKFL
jgi:2-amino-4-hydroxy-6-hydroxymethyldihydropteridine diphosphokinase